MGFSPDFSLQETLHRPDWLAQEFKYMTRITLFTTRVEINCYRSNFPGLPLFKKLAADKHVLADLPLVSFVFKNLMRLTAGVCMKVRFKSKVTRGFSFSPLRDSYFIVTSIAASWLSHLRRRKIKKNLWDQGNLSTTFSMIDFDRHVTSWFKLTIPLTLAFKRIQLLHVS